MFGFKKNHHHSAIVIDGTDAIVDDQRIATTVWQQRHVPSNIGTILSKAINISDDTLEIALMAYVHDRGMSMPLYEPFHRIAFTRQAGVSGNVWHHGADYHVTVKGIPERILEYCDMSENERESVTAQLHAMSATGAIVIAVATGMFTHSIKHLDNLKRNEKLSFVGFVSLQINVSAQARQLIAMAKPQNINIYLYTGQHHAATYSLTQQLGLALTPADVFDAPRLEVMDGDDIKNLVATTKLFSRCMPEDKKHILSAIKAVDPTVASVSTLQDLQKLLAK